MRHRNIAFAAFAVAGTLLVSEAGAQMRQQMGQQTGQQAQQQMQQMQKMQQQMDQQMRQMDQLRQRLHQLDQTLVQQRDRLRDQDRLRQNERLHEMCLAMDEAAALHVRNMERTREMLGDPLFRNDPDMLREMERLRLHWEEVGKQMEQGLQIMERLHQRIGGR